MFQIYRKAALRVVQDLGEEALPEPSAADMKRPVDGAHEQQTVETQQPPPHESSETTTPASSAAKNDDSTAKTTVTTLTRDPMKIPASVNVRITPETLKDYVGPPVYQKDRMYVTAPPAGVSTGLGYLGNGSGAVMPVEAMVC